MIQKPDHIEKIRDRNPATIRNKKRGFFHAVQQPIRCCPTQRKSLLNMYHLPVYSSVSGRFLTEHSCQKQLISLSDYNQPDCRTETG